jgi:Fungal specific transcription factor domain
MRLVHSPELIDRAVQIYAGLWNLTLTLDRLPTKAIRGVHVEFGDRLVQLEAQILELINMAKFNEIDDKDDSDILSVFSTAALIYLYTYLRANPRRSSNIVISKRLRQILEQIDIFRIAHVYPDLLLWVLTTAGLETVDPDESFWYVETAKRLCRTLGFYLKAQVNQIVRGFVWRENARDKHHIVDCTEFWDLVFTGSMYYPVMDEMYNRFQVLEESEDLPNADRILPLPEPPREAKTSLLSYSSSLPIWHGSNSPQSKGSSMSPDSSTSIAHRSISTAMEDDSTDTEPEPVTYEPHVTAIGGSREHTQTPNLTVVPQPQVCQWSHCNADYDSAADLE